MLFAFEVDAVPYLESLADSVKILLRLEKQVFNVRPTSLLVQIHLVV